MRTELMAELEDTEVSEKDDFTITAVLPGMITYLYDLGILGLMILRYTPSFQCVFIPRSTIRNHYKASGISDIPFGLASFAENAENGL